MERKLETVIKDIETIERATQKKKKKQAYTGKNINSVIQVETEDLKSVRDCNASSKYINAINGDKESTEEDAVNIDETNSTIHGHEANISKLSENLTVKTDQNLQYRLIKDDIIPQNNNIKNIETVDLSDKKTGETQANTKIVY